MSIQIPMLRKVFYILELSGKWILNEEIYQMWHIYARLH